VLQNHEKWLTKILSTKRRRGSKEGFLSSPFLPPTSIICANLRCTHHDVNHKRARPQTQRVLIVPTYMLGLVHIPHRVTPKISSPPPLPLALHIVSQFRLVPLRATLIFTNRAFLALDRGFSYQKHLVSGLPQAWRQSASDHDFWAIVRL